MKYLFWGFLCLLFLPACFKPTYPDNKLAESVENIVQKEYKIKDVKAERKENTLWIYVPTERMVDKNFELDKDAVKKIGNVSHVGSRVIFSSDTDVKFIALIAYDKVGIELKMIRHIEDVKKVRVWYIAYSDFYSRMDIDLGFNPEILGRRAVEELYTDIKENKITGEEISKYFPAEAEEEVFDDMPREFGSIKKLCSVRIKEEQALVYLQTTDPASRSLFLVDVGFFDILKQLLILYLSKEEKLFEDKEEKKEKIKLPVISGYWNLSKKSWPRKYRDYKNVDDWEKHVFAREIEFKKFIAKQIKRRVKKRFEEKYDEWDIKFRELDVTYLRDEILVTREIYELDKKIFDVDIDHEISLTAANAIRNYELNEVKALVIGSPGWGKRTTIEKEKLLELKPKKWKRLIKEEKPDGLSILDLIVGMFVPNYNTQLEKTARPKEEEN